MEQTEIFTMDVEQENLIELNKKIGNIELAIVIMTDEVYGNGSDGNKNFLQEFNQELKKLQEKRNNLIYKK